MLTDVQIKQLAPTNQLVPAQKLVVTPAKYNQVQPRYNAITHEVALHNQAPLSPIAKITPMKPEGILIDQFTPEANYRKYLQGGTTSRNGQPLFHHQRRAVSSGRSCGFYLVPGRLFRSFSRRQPRSRPAIAFWCRGQIRPSSR